MEINYLFELNTNDPEYNYKIAAFQGAVMLTSEGNPIAMAVVGR